MSAPETITDGPLGTLFVVSAPSGAGKTSLVKALATELADLLLSVSHTTRPRRETETDGVDYHFVSQTQFRSMLAAGDFLEHAEVFGNYYGTSTSWVDERLSEGKNVVLEIDVQGAKQIRTIRECTGIFVLPPALRVLESRLRGRGQDSDEVIAGRLAEAVHEMSHYGEFDFLVVNDTFEEALGELTAVVTSVRLRTGVQSQRHSRLITALLDS